MASGGPAAGSAPEPAEEAAVVVQVRRVAVAGAAGFEAVSCDTRRRRRQRDTARRAKRIDEYESSVNLLGDVEGLPRRSSYRSTSEGGLEAGAAYKVDPVVSIKAAHRDENGTIAERARERWIISCARLRAPKRGISGS